jgi:succinyl-CoA synthetase beta subunit
MILYEFEGKKILSQNGVNVPKSQIITSTSQKLTLNYPLILKAQVLSGKRKVAGGILEATTKGEATRMISGLLSQIINKEKVETVLVEEKAEFDDEYYLSITYDTKSRGPVLSFSVGGGTGIEDRGAEHFAVDPILFNADLPKNHNVPDEIVKAIPVFVKLFFSLDLLLLEINPLVIGKNGQVIALDAKMKTDDNASPRHKDWDFPPRAIPGYKPTEREILAKKIDEGDYRGTAGSAYFDLPGDIAVLASGGGGSLTAMDALLAAGGKPANYTEYSGNPPKEKVEKLTKIVLSKEGLHGLWVVGAVANFTDIYETLSGLIEALRTIKPKIKLPIVIRRGGPRDKDAFEMLQKVKDFDLHLYGQEISITESAKIMADLAQKYAIATK